MKNDNSFDSAIYFDFMRRCLEGQGMHELPPIVPFAQRYAIPLSKEREHLLSQESVCHKRPVTDQKKKVSIVLLDWSCRESLHGLDWLQKQTVARDEYELIWVELHDRVLDEACQKADVVLSLQQQGKYHKHEGYNAGIIASQGELICVCDSDAVFPPDFIESILRSFEMLDGDVARELVLMHQELRTSSLYPSGLDDTEQLKDQDRWEWWAVNLNVGACVTVRKSDAIRLGGFDEDESYRGYMCGPYDLAWRLINLGVPQLWHDIDVVLWHFAHPDPVGVNGIIPSFRGILESTYPHIVGHALTSVEKFSTGDVMPRRINEAIKRVRMRSRQVGSTLELEYADYAPDGFSKVQVARMRFGFLGSQVGQLVSKSLYPRAKRAVASVLRPVIGRRARQSLSGLSFSELRALTAKGVRVVAGPIVGRRPTSLRSRLLGVHPEVLKAMQAESEQADAPKSGPLSDAA